MIPFSQIQIGDRFSDPLARNYGHYSGLIFEVIEKNKEGIPMGNMNSNIIEIITPRIDIKNI